MKLIYTIFIQLIILVNIQSQNVIAEYHENNIVRRITEFRYDEENRVIERIHSAYYKAEQETVQRSKTEWVYENDKLVLLKKDYFDSYRDVKLEYENIYDGNGCLIEQNQKNFISPSEIIEHRIIIDNQFDCANPWKNNQENSDIYSYSYSSKSESKLTRKRTDTSEIEIFEEYDELTREWIKRNITERKYNEKNKIVEMIDSLGFYIYAEKNIYSYDDTGENIMSSECYYKNDFDSEWEKHSRHEYIYENSLLRKINLIGNNGLLSEHLLEYYCDGLLKKNTRILTRKKDDISILNYEYDQKINCPEKCEQLENLSVKIYPNPVTDIFYVESDIFQKESSEMLIYNALGKLIYRQEVNQRVPGIQVNLNPRIDLNQMIIIHLISDGGFSISKKVLIQN